ncbi:hypothetical protein [Parvicella tangerina]|uniref:Uncharacterized protein n=1 Tax=Parvicella tangerina TaxID=2829795 RepID=A0A916JMV6_9FLAO|nr:hypothetical protein [Parvicella tangerina]CAG5079966.1 hypothetical protein CRYO30217_01135 [Parvicella tangerina]
MLFKLIGKEVMTNKLAEIFSIFHDGGIDEINVDGNSMEITIGCAYLAQMENEEYKNFYLSLENVTTFEFHTWDDEIFTDIPTMVNFWPEIMTAEIEKETIKVVCNIDTENKRTGGLLWIKANLVSLKNHKKAELSINQLETMSRNYWDNFGRK